MTRRLELWMRRPPCRRRPQPPPAVRSRRAGRLDPRRASRAPRPLRRAFPPPRGQGRSPSRFRSLGGPLRRPPAERPTVGLAGPAVTEARFGGCGVGEAGRHGRPRTARGAGPAPPSAAASRHGRFHEPPAAALHADSVRGLPRVRQGREVLVSGRGRAEAALRLQLHTLLRTRHGSRKIVRKNSIV